jgi:hypothetical protein
MDLVNQKVKGFQPRGNYGYRDITRRPFMVHIPKFDPDIAAHLALASLSDTSHDIVAKHHFIKKGFKAMRNEDKNPV